MLSATPARSPLFQLLALWLIVGSAFALLAGCRNKVAEMDAPAVTASSSAPASPVAATDADYVEDAACAQCHADIAARYATHPMARSLSSGLREVARNAQGPATFRAGTIEYSTRPTDTGLLHSQALLSGDDHLVTQEFPVAFVVGSGSRGQSYLIARERRLWMSPLTWYPRTATWGLSPGYETNNLGFDRPVLDDCLFCHSNGAARVQHSKNEYRDPPFPNGEGIGCQRCHGPGQAHVQLHQTAGASAMPDPIVNPRHLPAPLREAVCQQCHLAGAARVVRAGHDRNEFCPGQPLDATLATYVLTQPSDPDTVHFVGQVEQMVSSQCYQQSEGELGCISCHDPHAQPRPGDRVAFYRSRCLTCHTETSCSIALTDRQSVDGTDDCIRCHMPPMPTDVRHTSSTDHRVLRSPLALPSISQATYPLQAFPPRTSGDNVERGRDLAMGVLQAAPYHPRRFVESHLAQVARPLQQAVQRNPFDLAGLEALGDLERHLDRRGAETRYQTVLRQQPHREHSLVLLAAHWSAAGQWAQAAEAWQKVCQLHGPNPAYRSRYAEALAAAGLWNQATQVAREGTQEFPLEPRLWRMATECYLRNDNETEATKALEVLKALLPEEKASLETWFRNHRFRR